MIKDDIPIPEECEFSVISLFPLFLGCVWNHTFAVSCLVSHLLPQKMMEYISWLGSAECTLRFTSIIGLHWMHMGWGMGANVRQSLVINAASISPWSGHYGPDNMDWTRAKVDHFRKLFFFSLSLILFYSSDLVILQETKYRRKINLPWNMGESFFQAVVALSPVYWPMASPRKSRGTPQ